MVEAVIGSEILMDSNSKEVQVSYTQAFDLICLYSSAHWCPPCRVMTPKLSRIYRDTWSATKKICVIFISFDRDEETMMEYFEEMPWLAVPFNQHERRTNIADKFDICAIPSVILLTKEGTVLTSEGYADILSMGEGALVHWLAQVHPKPPETSSAALQPAAVVEQPAAVAEKPAEKPTEQPATVAEKPAEPPAAAEKPVTEAEMPAPEANIA